MTSWHSTTTRRAPAGKRRQMEPPTVSRAHMSTPARPAGIRRGVRSSDPTTVVGVAPDIRIYSVRVSDNRGNGSYSSIACGVDWVTANAAALNIKVANLSLEGAGTDDGNCGNSNADALHRSICGSVAAG